MTTTGFTDTFGRTVSNGLGTATSGQAYTLSGTASQYSVAPNVATIAPNSGGDKFGYADNLTQDVDITGQVALTAIPATNLTTVGFVAKLSAANNYFVGSMMVAAGGQVSLRFSKVVAGSLVTISTTTVTGLTYVANTFYNLRYRIVWSPVLQTNVMQLKLWAIGANPPGGWMAVAMDASFTNYTAGTSIGLHTRDEAAAPGAVAAKFQNVATSSYHLPMPAATDPMCYDPAFAYPRQAALESLADATDVAVAALDPLVTLAGLYPRVRVSNTGLPLNTSTGLITFSATEFNVNTPTNLALDSSSLYLPSGIWACTFEMQLAEAASDYFFVSLGNNSSGQTTTSFRSNPNQNNDQGVGGSVHCSQLIISTDPTTPARINASPLVNNSTTTYTATYVALSAVKISDYFT